MTQFITHIHEDLRSARFTRRGATHRAEDVPKGTHKEYPRMERLLLPEPQPIENSLRSVLLTRRSSYFKENLSTLSLGDFGTLFGLALRRRQKTTSRNYPSGGGLYPIETYLITEPLVDGTSGIFHYHPTVHALEKLWDVPAENEVRTLIQGPEGLSFSALIVFTSVWKRSSAKYGDFTYTVALLEAGHMSENILLVATALGFETRPMAGFKDRIVPQLLDIDEEHEQVVHSITLAKK